MSLTPGPPRRLTRRGGDRGPGSGAFALLLLLLPGVASAQVRFDQGLVYQAAHGPREVRDGDPLSLAFDFTAAGPLDRRYDLFVHLEGGSEACRLVRDEPLLQGDAPSTGWTAAAVTARASWPRVERCGAGAYEVYVGLFDPEHGDRLAVLDGDGDFDRIHAGRVVVRPAGEAADDGVVTLEPLLARPAAPPLEVPGVVLLLLLALLAAAAAGAALWLRPRATAPAIERAAAPGPWRVVPFFVPLLVLGAGVAACLGFVKDDAYISFRYARNLVSGRGLVFNEGERVEGYTNFLWTLLMAPFEAAGADLVQVCDVIGPLLAAALVVLVVRASRELDGPGPALSHLWGATWLASSSSFALWAVGGLEQSLAALLPFAGAALTYRGWLARAWRRCAAGGLLLALACLTRPEGHLFVIVIGLVMLVADRSREARRLALAWLAPIAALLGPYHAWRALYFGALLPNTYLVKAVAGPEVYRAGVGLLADMLRFNATGALVAVAALSLLVATHRAWRWPAVALAVGFMAYVVKIGTDELMWHRLFLPALPFVAMGAGAAARMLATAASARLAPRLRWAPYAAGWAVVALACWANLSFTLRETRGLGGYGGCSGANHPDLGKFLTRHGRPGELVAFQDMGATPYHAPDLRFLDLVGLVDRQVALRLRRHGVHPFVGATRAARGGELCADLRRYVLGRRPEWVVLVPWPGRRLVGEVAEGVTRADPEAVLRRSGAFANTQFDCHLYHDPAFRQRYAHVRTWMRSPVYYLSAFRRRDLWEAPPAGVVYARAPASVRGPRATYANGVELLGGEVERRAVVERHEVFVTTWWRVPGPRPDDLQVFVHVARQAPPRTRTSLDHPPGDWMYPASRWRQGEVVRDRVLVHLPVGLVPGRYDVHVGLFDRRTGERVAITSGRAEPDQRVLLGHLDVRPMRHFLDPLIPRTDPREQRR